MKALGVAQGAVPGAIAYAQSQGWRDAQDVVKSIQMGVVAPTGTNDIAPPTPASSDFADFIRPLTILGKLAGLRRVPSRVRSITATAGSGAYWAGEAQPRPISRMTFEGETLAPLAVSAIVITTKELLRSSAPGAESALSRDLAKAAGEALDSAFIDPLNNGIANVKPAAITEGVGAFASTGSTLAQIDADLAALINALSEAGSDLEFATFILSPKTATYLAGLRGTGGALAYPGMTAKGGTLLGLPAITSTAVPRIGSPSVSSITLLDPAQILVCDESAAGLEVSEEGALQMESTPGSGAQNLVSLWQTEAAALKMTRYINWRRCRDDVARVLTGVSY